MAEMVKKATRESYGEALAELAEEYPQVVVLDADLAAATKTGIFKKACPERFIDCGIAECNMIRLNRLELVGTQFDVKSLFGTVGFKGSVDYTVVNGKVVVENGQLVTIDEEKVAADANRVVEKFISKANL